MTKNELSVRRVGTFTMGLFLIIAGIAMFINLVFPQLNLTPLIKAAPLVLVSLGVETLLAVRGNQQIRYDWVSMILCCVIVGAALAMTFFAWYLFQGYLVF